MKKKGAKKDRIWWISFLLVAIIAYGLGLITYKYHIFPYSQIKYFKKVIFDEKKTSFSVGTKKRVSDYYLLKKSFFEINGAKADIVMIGDSLTDNPEWNELFSNINIVNRGISGDTTKGVLNRMESIYFTNAKKAFIMIGINDLLKNISVDEVLSNYEKIVSQLKKHEITPYIQSVLFLGDKHANKNKDILKLNLRLKELSDNKNIVFIDLNKALSENGKLKEPFLSEDDIHLNGEGYFVWRNSIKKYIQ